jgi:AhpD family alkylhydroperoxidase
MTRIAETKERDRRTTTVVDDLAKLHHNALQSGTLDKIAKELIAMAASIATGDQSGIAYHSHNALAAGAKPDHVIEAVEVTLMAMSERSAADGRRIIKALVENESDTDCLNPETVK